MSGNVCEFVKYRDFPDFHVCVPLDWFVDPYSSNNWVHNFLSLRWLYRLSDYRTRVLFALDFYAAVLTDESLQSHVSGRKRDHSSAIRAEVLNSLIVDDGFSGLSESERGVLKKFLVATVSEITSVETYKYGHNHGLLIDSSVLAILVGPSGGVLGCSFFLQALKRVSKQLSLLYCNAGYTLEHSISYQEYNLFTLFSIKGFLERGFYNIGWGSKGEVFKVIARIDSIIDSSRKILFSACSLEGSYIPFGHSFRLPNANILNRVYGCGSPAGFFDDDKSYLFCASIAGFGIYKGVDGIHAGMVNAFNANSHRSADQLSIYLSIAGRVVFDDAGFSDRLDGFKKVSKQRNYHSAPFVLSGGAISEAMPKVCNSQYKTSYFVNDNAIGFMGRFHSGGVEYLRIYLIIFGVGALIIDTFSGATDGGVGHGFLLGDVSVVLHGDCGWSGTLGDLDFWVSRKTSYEISELCVAGRKKTEVLSSKKLNLRYSEGGTVAFFVSFVGNKKEVEFQSDDCGGVFKCGDFLLKYNIEDFCFKDIFMGF